MGLPGVIDSLIAALLFSSGSKLLNELRSPLKRALENTVVYFLKEKGVELDLEKLEKIFDDGVGRREIEKFLSGDGVIDAGNLALQFAIWGDLFFDDESQKLPVSLEIFEYFKREFLSQLLSSPKTSIKTLGNLQSVFHDISSSEHGDILDSLQKVRFDIASEIGELINQIRIIQDKMDVGTQEEIGEPDKIKKIEDIISQNFRNFIVKVDSLILPTIRDHHYLSNFQLLRIYRKLIDSELLSLGFTIDVLLDFLNNTRNRELIAQAIGTPRLDIHIEGLFERIHFKSDKFQKVIEDPKLLWDCICIDKPEANCPIHSLEVADELTKLFNSSLVCIGMFDTKNLWQSSDYFFPPSIDAFWMLHDIIEFGAFKSEVENVIDVGCGSGILGIVASRQLPRIQQLIFTDWLVTPLFFSAINYCNNVERFYPNIRTSFLLGINTTWLNAELEGPYDMALCNPPYLPLTEKFLKIELETTVAGTELLEHVIENKSSIAKHLFFASSLLAYPEIDRAQKKLAKTSNLKIQAIGPERMVPFRIPYVLRNSEYINEMTKRGLKVDGGVSHRYWHKVQTFYIGE